MKRQGLYYYDYRSNRMLDCRRQFIKYINNEQGFVIIMALMILMILIVLGTAVLGVASMENKVSRNVYLQQQAQEAADAGLEWAIEKLYADIPPGIPGDMEQNQIQGTGSEMITWKVQCTELPAQENSYRYRLISTGTFQGVTKTVEATVAFAYDDSGMVFAAPDRRGIIKYATVK